MRGRLETGCGDVEVERGVGGLTLPLGWTDTLLSELVSLQTGPFGSSLHQSDYVVGGIPLINPMHIVAGRIRAHRDHAVSPETLRRLAEFKVSAGDVVIGRRGEMGRCAVVTQREHGWLCGTGSMVIRCGDALRPGFLQRLLSSREMMEILGQESVGSTMANLNQKVLLSVHVRLPPVEEQSRIIDAIDELMPDLKAGVDELAKAEKKLTTYRQSLLKAAVEGALTAEWRAQNPPKETGAELLFRILRARSEHWHGREAELANVKRPTRQRKSEYIEQVPAKELGSFDLPCGWTWAKVSTVGHVQLGRQRAPQFHRGDNMVPYLRVANVFEDRVDVSDVMSMHFSIDEQRTYTLTVGDILLNEGQSLELIGCPAIFRNELPRVCFTNSLVRFRVGQWVNAEYALIVFLH